jgi:ABC-type multidrug transport system fused ATPase/permease subunit
VKDLKVRYTHDFDPVLKVYHSLSKSQEKIGIVGRTGSGKSTLALSFFRFVEASRGSISIDNINIKDIDTESLRSNLTVIPQELILFSGSLSLDPFDEFHEINIYDALHRVHIFPSIAGGLADDTQEEYNLFKDLSTIVSEGGKNFSLGQRQLLCLARAY